MPNRDLARYWQQICSGNVGWLAASSVALLEQVPLPPTEYPFTEPMALELNVTAPKL